MLPEIGKLHGKDTFKFFLILKNNEFFFIFKSNYLPLCVLTSFLQAAHNLEMKKCHISHLEYFLMVKLMYLSGENPFFKTTVLLFYTMIASCGACHTEKYNPRVGKLIMKYQGKPLFNDL